VAGDNIHIKVEVELDNSQLIEPVSSLKLSQRHDWHHHFEVVAPLETIEGRQQMSLDKSNNFIGKSIKIAIKSQDASKQFNLFKGVITEVTLSRFGGTSSSIVIRGYSPTILLDDGPSCAAFLDKPLKQIVQTVTSVYPMNLLSVKNSPSSNPKLPFIVQYNESAYNFLGRIGNTQGQWFYYNGTDLIFGKLESEDTVPMKFGHDLKSFEASVRVSPLKFKGHAHDYINDEPLYSQSSSESVSGLDNWGNKAVSSSDSLYSNEQQFHFGESVADSAELKALVSTRKSALASELVVFSGISDNSNLKVGSKITVTGGSRASLGDDNMDYGSFTVIRISHQADGIGNYQNRFEAIPSTLTVPPLNQTVKVPICEMQRAEVVDNADPEGFGRVQVKFNWQKDGSTPWIRYNTLHAGKNRGFYVVPEIGDEVIVGFEGDNPSRPFVIGSYFNGKDNSSDRKNKDNLTKTIRTISGNELTFYDKEGEESIHIFNPNKSNEILITMKDDGLVRIVSNKKVYIEAKEDIEAKAKNMLFTAEEKIEFKAKEFKVGAQQLIDLASQKDWKSKGMDVTTEATSKLKMSANAGAEFKSNATMEISGMAKTSVKASGQLELSAAAQASLKAGIVMIN
jgi:type VI secretion system secreted protein VgrG